MADIRSAIPYRLNGKKIPASWFNTIRAFLINLFGGGVTEATTFEIENNTSDPANITGMAFDSTLYCFYEIQYTIYRASASEGRREHGRIFAHFNEFDDAWTIDVKPDGGNLSGVDFSNDDDDAQVQYISDNLSSQTEGTLTWAVVKTFNRD